MFAPMSNPSFLAKRIIDPRLYFFVGAGFFFLGVIKISTPPQARNNRFVKNQDNFNLHLSLAQGHKRIE